MAMPVEEQRRVLTTVYRELFWQGIQDWSQHAINVLEEQGINDYEQGHSNVEIPLAFMRVSALLLQQAFTEQHRRELQVMNEDTQFAASLSESIYDHLSQIQKLTEDVVTLQSYYTAALKHRKESNVNLLDAEGNTKPYAAETIERERLMKEEVEREWKADIQRQRDELERSYWGKAQPPEMDEGYDYAQLIMPLWAAGFRKIEKDPR